LRKIIKRTRIIGAAISLICALAILLVPFLVLPFGTFVLFLNELLFAALLVSLVPSAILDYLNQRWLRSIERQMPALVRGIAESQETGLTIVKALEKVVEDRLVRPALSDEIKKILIQMSWGTSFEDALRIFKERVGSPVVSRFCALVLEASRSGGQIKKVFAATSGFMEEMREMDQDLDSQMRPYLLVIYVAFMIFIFIAVMLVQAFFAPIEGTKRLLTNAPVVGVQEYSDFFYKNMLVSALTGGLMAGKLGERRVAGGLKHAILLSVLGYAIFFVLIPPRWMVL
jgi:flagellar protein FlaJ